MEKILDRMQDILDMVNVIDKLDPEVNQIIENLDKLTIELYDRIKNGLTTEQLQQMEKNQMEQNAISKKLFTFYWLLENSKDGQIEDCSK